MKVVIREFPEVLSKPIELPDIGELLMYPAFQNISAEDYWKHGTEFQRYLLSKIPLVHDKRYVSVRSGVWLLEPGTRSHVRLAGGWHIDGDAEMDHVIPEQRVYILSSACTAMTEFNLNRLEIGSDASETRMKFTARIRSTPEKFGVVGKAIEPNRIYMFSNHLHRAIDPERIEFRFFFRVRESDVLDISHAKPLRGVTLNSAVTGEQRPNIDYRSDRVVIHRPRSLSSSDGEFCA